MTQSALYGAPYSVYVRIARLVLEEIGVTYDLVPIDIFTPESLPDDYAARHPFGKIPAFEHDGFRLFETDAIARYAVAAFGGERLVPGAARSLARMTQIMRVVDNYAYRALVWGVFVEEVERGRAGQLNAEEMTRARQAVGVLEDLAEAPFLVGAEMTLADLWVAPIFAYFCLAPSGPALLNSFPKLAAWQAAMATRPSVVATRFPREDAA